MFELFLTQLFTFFVHIVSTAEEDTEITDSNFESENEEPANDSNDSDNATVVERS